MCRPINLTEVPGNGMEQILLGTVTSHDWEKWAGIHQECIVLDKTDHLLQQSNLLCGVSGEQWLPGFLSACIFKVFVKISHRCLEKPLCYSLEWSVLWVGNCLTGCSQRVVVNGSFSGWPQVGSARDQYLAQCCFMWPCVICKFGCVL